MLKDEDILLKWTLTVVAMQTATGSSCEEKKQLDTPCSFPLLNYLLQKSVLRMCHAPSTDTLPTPRVTPARSHQRRAAIPTAGTDRRRAPLRSALLHG